MRKERPDGGGTFTAICGTAVVVLQPATIVVTAGALGRPVGSAAAIISKKHQSCVVGHQQGRQVAYAIRADGKTLTAIIAGSCYEHDEDYMGAQGNHYWRGIVVLHEVKDGCFDEMFVSLDFLKKRYL